MFDALVVKKITWLKSNQWQNKHLRLAGCGDVILVLTECIFATLEARLNEIGKKKKKNRFWIEVLLCNDTTI